MMRSVQLEILTDDKDEWNVRTEASVDEDNKPRLDIEPTYKRVNVTMQKKVMGF